MPQFWVVTAILVWIVLAVMIILMYRRSVARDRLRATWCRTAAEYWTELAEWSRLMARRTENPKFKEKHYSEAIYNHNQAVKWSRLAAQWEVRL